MTRFALVALVIFAAGSAVANERCKTCWDNTCSALADLGLPKCAASPPKRKPVREAPVVVEKPSAPTAAPPPAPPAPLQDAGPSACPRGQLRTDATAGECCWPAQAWNGTRCVGEPSCPRGFSFDDAKEGCEVARCAAGMQRTLDGAHCCWPEQAWSPTSERCVGKPACPTGFIADRGGCIDEGARARAATEAVARDKARREGVRLNWEAAKQNAGASRLVGFSIVGAGAALGAVGLGLGLGAYATERQIAETQQPTGEDVVALDGQRQGLLAGGIISGVFAGGIVVGGLLVLLFSFDPPMPLELQLDDEETP